MGFPGRRLPRWRKLRNRRGRGKRLDGAFQGTTMRQVEKAHGRASSRAQTATHSSERNPRAALLSNRPDGCRTGRPGRRFSRGNHPVRRPRRAGGVGAAPTGLSGATGAPSLRERSSRLARNPAAGSSVDPPARFSPVLDGGAASGSRGGNSLRTRSRNAGAGAAPRCASPADAPAAGPSGRTGACRPSRSRWPPPGRR